ncbi:MAG TPA: hypothetical protein VFM14_15250 [Gemmatimonadales bacterium]|nr:hypothetical protein [Gemmatimonadales bacterium]
MQFRSALTAVPIREAKQLVIVGQAWKSQDEAEAAGLRAKHALALALASLRMGADLGDKKRGSFLYRAALQMIEQQFAVRALNDVHGLMTYEADPAPRFASVEPPSILRTMQPARFVRALERGYASGHVPTESEFLAIELYNGSFFERSPRARFLTLVMAVAALIELPDRRQEAQEHVSLLISQTRDSATLTQREKDSLIGALRWLLKESIRRSGMRLAEERLGNREYMELSAAAFFDHCYDRRSRMVHGGGVRGDEPIVGATGASLGTFVADLIGGYHLGFDA